MKWIVPDALAPAALTQTLAQALLTADAAKSARLSALFDAYLADATPYEPRLHGCSSQEWLQLQSMGLQPHRLSLPSGAFMAALHADIQDPTQRVWLAQATSTVVTPDRAMLIGLDDLQARDEDLLALHTSLAQALPLDEGPIQLQLLRPGVWRVTATFPDNAWLASPHAVQGQDLGDWWPTEEHWKPWRRFLNEIQMFWHAHPINEQRERQGLPPINGLWLYGGGHGWTPQEDPDVTWIDSLQLSASQGDWQSWLNHYHDVVEFLLDQTQQDPSAEIVLSGPERIVTLNKRPLPLWRRMLPTALNSRLTGYSARRSNPPSWSRWWNPV